MNKMFCTIAALGLAAISLTAPIQAQAASRDTDLQLAHKWGQAQKSCDGKGPTKRVIYQACGVADRHAGELIERGYCLNEEILVWARCTRKE